MAALLVTSSSSVTADVVGQPFVGDVGKVMDDIIEKAGAGAFSHAFTNVFCCVPRDPMDCSEEVPPPDEAGLACRPRLREFIALCKPRLIIAVGRVAERALATVRSRDAFLAFIPIAYVLHPSAILRQRSYGGASAARPCALAAAVAEHLTSER